MLCSGSVPPRLRALHGRPLLARGGAAERLPGDAGGGDAAGGAVPEDAWTKGEGMFQQVPSISGTQGGRGE